MTKKAKPNTDDNFEPHLLDTPAESARDALVQAGVKAEALVQAWVSRGNAGAVHEAAEHAAGSVRKAARRGLNVLRARGITIPERQRVVSVAGKAASETLEAWMLPPDMAGTVGLVIAARSLTSRYRAAFVFVHDAFGIQRIETGELSQSQLRDSFNRVVPTRQLKPIKVPLEWARGRIAEARKRHAELNTPEPLGLTSAASLLEPAPSQAIEHPFDGEGLELSDEDAREMVKNSDSLHLLPEFGWWFLPRQAMDEMLFHVGQGLEPGREPTPEELQQRVQQELIAATDRYFSPQRREQLVATMKDSCLSVLAREGEVRALHVVATMKLVQNAGLITDPPHEVPFLKAFFDKALSVLLAQNKGQLRIPVRQQHAAAAAEEGAAEASPSAEPSAPSES
jgi:hypothetical protein